MNEPKTIWLDHDELVKVGGEPVSTPAATASTKTSQYDVPEAIRSYYDEKGHCVIRLQYIGPDEPFTLIPSGHMQVQTGKNSGRIYAFLIDHPSPPDPAFNWANLHQAISVVEKQHPNPRKANYKLVDFLLTRMGERLSCEPDGATGTRQGAAAY